MKLGLRELRRRPGRFATAGATLTLVAALVMVLGGLLDGLIDGSTSALRAQDADLIVYSRTARQSLPLSRIDGDLRDAVEQADGVDATGGIGVAQLGGRLPGAGPRELVSVVLFGYEIPPEGVPEPPAPGEVYADRALQSEGVEEGTDLALGPARTPVRVVGFVDGLRYSGEGTLWAAASTWREVLSANRPDAAVDEQSFQALLVQVGDGAAASDVAEAIDAATGSATGSATETLTLSAAIDAIPGVREQRSTFNQIIGVTVAVAGVVVALFFALLTVERLDLYSVLKALGARDRTLLGGVVAQAVVVTVAACAVAAIGTLALDRALPEGGVPLVVTPRRIVTSTALLLVASTAGCAFSLRRVLRVDPATAIGATTP